MHENLSTARAKEIAKKLRYRSVTEGTDDPQPRDHREIAESGEGGHTPIARAAAYTAKVRPRPNCRTAKS